MSLETDCIVRLNGAGGEIRWDLHWNRFALTNGAVSAFEGILREFAEKL